MRFNQYRLGGRPFRNGIATPNPLTRGLVLAAAMAMVGLSASYAAEPVDYVRDVTPILESYCIGCHTADDPQGGLVMETYAALMAGGDHGAAITEGVAASSRLYLMAAGEMEPVMPPDDADGPDEQELAVLADWIDQGAAGPRADARDEAGSMRRRLRVPQLPPVEFSRRPITAIAAGPAADPTGDGWVALARTGSIELRRGDQTLRTIEGEFGKVNAMEFSPDGNRLLVATGLTGAVGAAMIFDVKSGEAVTELVGHKDVLYDAAWSPDASMVATGGYDRDVRIWNVATSDVRHVLKGHNGAIFDLEFSDDGALLFSGSGDETVKVWNVADGERLDTLSQPEGEVFAVETTPDGRFILAASSDNRIRVWQLKSVDGPTINPILATRFIDESAIVSLAWVNRDDQTDPTHLVAASAGGNFKVIRTSDWTPVAALDPAPDSVTGLVARDDTVLATLMNGDLVRRTIPELNAAVDVPTRPVEPILLTIDKRHESDESDSIPQVQRHALRRGTISSDGQVDRVRMKFRAGEVWAIDGNRASKSKLDPVVWIETTDGRPVMQTRLQAVRDSYFTFRGKNSTQSNDFRLFNFAEIGLDQYVYASGEVTRTWSHPRGPDSGFNVYPGQGNRVTFFGSPHLTHALGDPAYIVRELAPGETPEPNGLPVFDIPYRNDDGPRGLSGKDSRLLFTAPADGDYIVAISDTRGMGGSDFGYDLIIRPAAPDYTIRMSQPKKELFRGTGREFTITADRLDGFDGEIELTIDGLPEMLVSNFPTSIEAEQRLAVGNIWCPADPSEDAVKSLDGQTATVVARGLCGGRVTERIVGTVGPFTVSSKPPVAQLWVQPIDQATEPFEPFEVSVPRGETIRLRVVLKRKPGDKVEVRMGKEFAGRNAIQGVYVDNIGLNGLLVIKGADQREFFVTADASARPGPRTMHLEAETDGKVTSHPFIVRVE